MRPKSEIKHSAKDLQILKRTIKNTVETKRQKDKIPGYATPLPESIGIKLTNQCNLRCKHCYQWNEDGYHHFMTVQQQREQLDYHLLERLILETEEARSRLYIWGGEPLVYSEFNRLADLLERHPRETTICTNAMLIERNLDSLLRISDNLELLIALDGFEEENDALRGKGVFARAIQAIRKLVELRKENRFRGKISIHTVINDSMTGKLYDLLDFLESIGVDLVIVCFPWYISDECSQGMDDYFDRTFDYLAPGGTKSERSWHAFKYKLDPAYIPALMNELERINNRTWKLRLRYQPNLEHDQIEDFVLGKEVTGEGTMNKKCLALSNRMDITPDGTIIACKFFKEFEIGNLKEASVNELWHSLTYRKIRESMDVRLTPACSKCSVLHLHGV
ncbi:radical SAM protein with 4Fe4S-binding SPASM domain [Paenibacillus phyllosphaerae]|uniref:Radical SAM protein with 4Fe4S-binding SPASM domain n=1 Tax=Paenibacillus phyllosphaerae TaxID=274593 RepID=A0A7W5B4E4_9BACL|nr:radical SAM protein [Paenibacillus phyllosphaerae]MBB3114187.1 radical SAM protein with 4Fe4S-binding SPASM domain [Paenibacillus phyllosphaerae]